MASSLSFLGAVPSVQEIESLIAGIDKIMPFVLLASQQGPDRSIIADDLQFDASEGGGLISAQAFAVIRAGTQSVFPVDNDLIAIDGRKIREFKPQYDRVIQILNLRSDEGPFSAEHPVREFTSVPASDSIDILSEARSALIGMLPERNQQALTKSSTIVPWLLALGAVGLVIKSRGA